MKGEGRQRGVAQSYPILPTPLSQQRRHVKTVDSTKVSRKPTNQSTLTGKCSWLIHPASKTKDKVKGTKKLRSIESDHAMIGCGPGASVTSALAYLASDISYDDGDEYDDNYDYDNVEFGSG